MQPGPRNALTDVPGIRIGHASDSKAKTGVTVILPDAPMTASVHVMGGAPGTRETDLLDPDKTVEQIHGLVLSGGSAFGLDAASAVMEALVAEEKGFAVGPAIVPIVPAAILFDLLNGGDKSSRPYKALAADAYALAGEDCPVGSVGAGTGAIAGSLKGGLGTASLVLPDGTTVAAIVACNALGNATCSETGHFWAAALEQGVEFGGKGVNANPVSLDTTFATKMDAAKSGANTTIAMVCTDAALTKAQCNRLAIAAHDGFARALYPAHTPFDGDLIFAGSTGARPLSDPVADTLAIGHAASICMARAIARGIHAATEAPGDIVPTWQKRFGEA